jgi:hypothetical protein
MHSVAFHRRPFELNYDLDFPEHLLCSGWKAIHAMALKCDGATMFLLKLIVPEKCRKCSLFFQYFNQELLPSDYDLGSPECLRKEGIYHLLAAFNKSCLALRAD